MTSNIHSVQTAVPTSATPAPLSSATIAPLAFPTHVLVGSLGDLAHLQANGNEISPEAYFMCSLTLFGATVAPQLRVDPDLTNGIVQESRLYTALLGDSSVPKKSSAVKKSVKFFQDIGLIHRPSVCGTFPNEVCAIEGVGSGEGLAKELGQHPKLLVMWDELKSLLDKCQIQGSVLTSAVSSLFEKTSYYNSTKDSTVCIDDGRLSMIGCSTLDTYETMWSNEALAMGLTNRFLGVILERRCKVALTGHRNKQARQQQKLALDTKLKQIEQRIQAQIRKLPLQFDFTPDAYDRWTEWYEALEESRHAARLDTIGLRLLPILALTTDKTIIDVDTVELVIAILDYQLKLRKVTCPIDAKAHPIVKLENKITKFLQKHGSGNPVALRDLRRHSNADREGMGNFGRALHNLQREDVIDVDDANKVAWLV